MSDVFILLDPGGKVLSMNQAVTDLLDYREKDIVRRRSQIYYQEKYGYNFYLQMANIDGRPKSTVMSRKIPVGTWRGYWLQGGWKEISTSVAVSTLWNRNGSIAGYVVIARDITEQKQIESERERLINELQVALSNLKVLRGLLPICANCKKIRNDEGYWQDVTVLYSRAFRGGL